MSPRCRQDLVGCTNNLKNLLHRWNEAVAQVEESWSDQTAKKFQEENLSTVSDCFGRLIAGLQEATDLVHTLEKQLRDDEI